MVCVFQLIFDHHISVGVNCLGENIYLEWSYLGLGFLQFKIQAQDST